MDFIYTYIRADPNASVLRSFEASFIAMAIDALIRI